MNDSQLDRYSRHLLLPQFDYDGQMSLLKARVLILGAGGLGSAAASYLAAAGIGHLVISDPDTVEMSNLQRQIIHCEARIGENKSVSAAKRIKELNSDVRVDALDCALEEKALSEQVRCADIVLDCTDNSTSRRLINRACWQATTPLVSAAAIRFEGQLMVVDPRQNDCPCYECVYPESDHQDATCSESGILSPVVGMMGVFQALEAIKLLSAVGENLTHRLTSFDGLTGQWRSFGVKKSKTCPTCQ